MELNDILKRLEQGERLCDIAKELGVKRDRLWYRLNCIPAFWKLKPSYHKRVIKYRLANSIGRPKNQVASPKRNKV